MPQLYIDADVYVVVGKLFGVAGIIVAITVVAIFGVSEVFKNKMKIQKKWHYLRRLVSTI